MNIRPVLVPLVLFLFSISGCVSFEERVAETYPDGASVLQLVEKSPLHVEGHYLDNDVSFSFRSQTTDEILKITIEDSAGSPVLVTTASGDGVQHVISIGERSVEIKQGLNYDCNDVSPAEIAAIEWFSKHEIFRSLPKLSRSLAMLNVTGKEFPAALPLHQWGMSAERHHGKPRARPDDGDKRVPMMYANPYASQIVKIAIDDFNLVDDIYGCNQTAGPFVPPETAEAISDACSLGPACTAENEPDPNNGCHGQCGVKCDCWSWVCGECCVNKACELHDEFAIDCWVDGEFNGSEIGSCPLAVLGIPAAPFGIPICGIFGF